MSRASTKRRDIGTDEAMSKSQQECQGIAPGSWNLGSRLSSSFISHYARSYTSLFVSASTSSAATSLLAKRSVQSSLLGYARGAASPHHTREPSITTTSSGSPPPAILTAQPRSRSAASTWCHSVEGFRGSLSTTSTATPLPIAPLSASRIALTRANLAHELAMMTREELSVRSASNASDDSLPANKWPTGSDLPSRPTSPRSPSTAIR